MIETSFWLQGEAVPVHVAERAADLEPFRRWVAEQREPVAVDTEGKGLAILSGDPEYVRLVQFGNAREAWVIPVELGEPFREACRWALLRLPDITGHNWHSFDAVALAAYLRMPLDPLLRKGTDTMILAALIDPRQPQEGGIGTGLKPLSQYWLDPEAADTQGDLAAVFRSIGETKSSGWAAIDLFHPTYVSYAGGDVILTSRLRIVLEAEIKRLGVRPAMTPYEHRIACICAHMMWTGILLDTPYTLELRERLTAEEERYAQIAAGLGVANFNATAQVSAALLAMGEGLSETTDSGKIKVDKPILLALADLDAKWNRVGLREPNILADAIIRAKRAGKWRSAFVDTFLETVDPGGRIHPFIGSMRARTARMSITRPAVQTLPSSDWMIRRAFLADEGHRWGSCDFQAIEMRVLAALADVRRMKEGFQRGNPDGSDFDIHMFTAREIEGPAATQAHRKLYKGAGFGKVYGGGVTTLSRQTGAPPEAIRRVLSAYDRFYPEIERASKRWQREARAYGMVSVSVTGRRLPLDRDRPYAVVNYLCQSAARDVLGQSMINMEDAGLLPYLRLPIHDEVVFSAPAAEAEDVAREIQNCMTWDLFGVPIVGKAVLGKRSWGSLPDYGAPE